MNCQDEAAAAARAFVDAIIWGEHTSVWNLMAVEARATAVSVALANGMDRVVASRILDGLADPSEFDDFQGQLLRGLRRDLRSVDAERILIDEVTIGAGHDQDQVADRANDQAGERVRVQLIVPSELPGTSGWPAGTLVLVRESEHGWRVVDLEPRVIGP